MDRRTWLIATGGSAAQFTPARAAFAQGGGASASTSLRVPGRSTQLHVEAAGSLVAVTREGEVWRMRDLEWQRLGVGLDPNSPVSSGHGRLAGRSVDGGLWVHEAGRTVRLDRPVLAPHAGLLVLAFGIVAVAVGGDGEHRALRFEPAGATWIESARGRDAVLPDARPLQFDPAGAGADPDANGHVIVFGSPSSRYRHGVLGDAIEPTSLMLLERHGLDASARIVLPPPYVFEDIAPRPIAWRGGRALLTVRSGPLGAQLCVVARSAEDAGRLELAALGEPIGTAHRWMAPSTDGRHLLAVVTPHLGGVLHRHTPEGARLRGDVIARGLSNHAIGRRDLDVSAWVGSRWVVPAQERRHLLVIDTRATAAEAVRDTIPMPDAVTALKPIHLGARPGVAALLDDGSARWVPVEA